RGARVTAAAIGRASTVAAVAAVAAGAAAAATAREAAVERITAATVAAAAAVVTAAASGTVGAIGTGTASTCRDGVVLQRDRARADEAHAVGAGVRSAVGRGDVEITQANVADA